MGRAWNDLHERCGVLDGVTGDLYAVIGDDYDERAARWLLAAIEREARSGRLVHIVSVPADPIYEVSARFSYQAEDGEVSQVAAKSRSQRYPLYPALEPADWGAEVEVTYSDGSRLSGAGHALFESRAAASLAARIFPGSAPLSLRGALGAEAQENRSVWRVREAVADASQQLRNCQRYRPAPGVCAVYQGGLDALGDQQVLAALFGDLTIAIEREANHSGPAFLGRNGVLSPTKHRGVSAVRYQRTDSSVAVVLNPWSDAPISPGLFRRPVWVLDGERFVLAT